MKSISLILLLATPILAFAETPAPAESPKPKKDPAAIFKSMDKDGDGKLTKEEFFARKTDKAQAEKAWTGKDKNADGSLTFEEFSAKKK